MHESRVTSIGADVRTSESAPEPVAAVFLHVHVAKVHTVHVSSDIRINIIEWSLVKN